MSTQETNAIKAIFAYASPTEYIDHLTNILSEHVPDTPEAASEAIIMHTNLVNMVWLLNGLGKE